MEKENNFYTDFYIRWFKEGIALGAWVENLNTKTTRGANIRFVFIFFEVRYYWLATFKSEEEKINVSKTLNIKD